MIQNELQYHLTKIQIGKFTEALARLETKPHATEDWKIKIQRNSMQSTLEELRENLQEYEQLKAGNINASAVTSLDDLPKALIRARIAKGLSQKDLAERLGMTEREVLDNETNLYSTSNLHHLKQIAEILQVEIEGKVHLLASK
jgi:ribosome-binding protein aMBF1 (putative translation factor)